MLANRAIGAATSCRRAGNRVTDPNLDSEPTDSFGASPEPHDDPSREFVQELESVDPGQIGPIARFHPRSLAPANRDPEFPTAYRMARAAAVTLISATTMMTAWWLIHTGVIGWLAGLFWNYLSWLPLIG